MQVIQAELFEASKKKEEATSMMKVERVLVLPNSQRERLCVTFPVCMIRLSGHYYSEQRFLKKRGLGSSSEE